MESLLQEFNFEPLVQPCTCFDAVNLPLAPAIFSLKRIKSDFAPIVFPEQELTLHQTLESFDNSAYRERQIE